MRPNTERDYHERMLRVLVYIQQHLDEAMPLDELARVAYFSPYHFHRVFRGMVGESVKEHVRRLRLERAAQRLKFGDQPVTRIALDAGYEALESFSRKFRAMFGEAPSRFREIHKSLAYAMVPSGIHFDSEGEPRDFRTYDGGGLNVRIETMDPMWVAFVRRVGPYDEVGSAWQTLMGWAGQRGLLGPHARTLGICHDDPDVTPADKIRYDACLAVGDQVQPAGDIGVQEIGGGEYAVTTHRGPYEKLGETYAILCGQWAPQSGRELRAPSLEFYRNSPMTTAPEGLVTDIHMPLEPR